MQQLHVLRPDCSTSNGMNKGFKDYLFVTDNLGLVVNCPIFVKNFKLFCISKKHQ